MNPPTSPASNWSHNWHARAFFGLHYDLHANAKDTELGAGLTPEHLRAELDKIGPDFVQCDCKGHAGYTSWPTEVGTPSPGIVHDALRIHRDVTRAMGIPLVMHYSGVWDNRAIELHPDWARVGPEGDAAGKEGFVTGATCNLSAYTTDLMIPQMLELIEKYDVDGFWVDGENWATKACYCDRCKTEFKRRTGIAEAPQAPGEENWTAWANFHREIFVEHVRLYTDAIHARKAECAVCSNWMYTVGQPEPIAASLDYLSGDFSWKWSLPAALLEGRFMDGRRLNNPGLTWDLMAWAFTSGEENMGGWTFKHAPGLCQEAAAVIGLGGSFLMYNKPQRSGHLTGWQQDVMAEVARFAFARRAWCEGTTSVPQAAVLHNAAHFYDQSGEVLMAAWSGAQKPVNGALHALLENHLSVDVLAEDALLAHLDQYALLVIAEQTLISDALHATVTDWVRRGGRLLLSGSETVLRFAELAGVAADGELHEGFFSIGVDGESTTAKGPWLPIQVTGAGEMHHIFKGPDPRFNEAIMPASTVHNFGEGVVVAVPGPLFGYFADTHYPRTRKLVGQMIGALHPELAVTMEAPARVHLMLRRKADQLILHLLNTGTGHPLAPSAVMVEDVPRVGPVKLYVKTAGPPSSVYLAPSMEGLTWTWDGGGVHVHVESIGIMDSVVITESDGGPGISLVDWSSRDEKMEFLGLFAKLLAQPSVRSQMYPGASVETLQSLDQMLVSLERTSGAKLPPTYVAFLERWDGGVVITDSSHSAIVNFMVTSPTTSDPYKFWNYNGPQSALMQRKIPTYFGLEKYILFGVDEGSNFWAFDTENIPPDGELAVYFCDMETGKSYFQADGFASFITALCNGSLRYRGFGYD